MPTIKLTIRKIIDPSTEDLFEKNILHYSFEEFLLKSQVYNPEGKLNTFTEMKAIDGRANSLHYKSGFAIDGFIGALKNIIPGFTDNIGRPVNFETYNFELIESSVSNRTLHKAAIHYTTPRLILHQTIGNYLVLGKEDESTRETFTIKMTDNLSIVFLEGRS